MRFKKALSALLAGIVGVSAIPCGVLGVHAEDDGIPLIFDIMTEGSNGISLTSNVVEDGDFVLPVKVYIPSNPGVNQIGLKFQINDGEIDQDDVFHNYGFYLMDDSGFASPYCFDSAAEGDASAAFAHIFTPAAMNLVWSNFDPESNVDSSCEAGTTAWTKDVSWAYENAFLDLSLVVPQNTPVGTYTFDIRTEKYVNLLAASAGTVKYGKSQCLSAESAAEVPFESIPLTIEIIEPETTTTTTTTTEAPIVTTTTEAPVVSTTTKPVTTTEPPVVSTTSKPVTTTEPPVVTTTSKPVTTTEPPVVTTTSKPVTTTEPPVVTTTTKPETSTEPPVVTTTKEPVTPPAGDYWQDDYKIENGGLYYIIGDVCGKPGEDVEVPVYVYGDTGTCAIRVYVAYDPRLTIYDANSPDRDYAYTSSWTVNYANPICLVTLPKGGYNAVAADGSGLFSLYLTIPEDAEPGTVYKFDFSSAVVEGKTRYSEALEDLGDDKTAPLDVTYYGGSLTVVADDTTPTLNYDSYSLTKPGEYINLTLFHGVGDVVWSSSNPDVATVDQNGFVVATGLGDVEITAACGEITYTCTIHVGLFGDVDGNGQIQVIDALSALQAAAAIMSELTPTLTEAQLRVADVNGDGVVTVTDAQYILIFYARNTALIETTWREITKNPNAPDTSNLK